MPEYENIGFALNFTNIVEIDITPNASERTWAWLAEGISNMKPEGNEVVDNTPYYSGGGMSSTDVTGGQLKIPFSGHRVYGDPAQDFIASKALAYGQARKTNCRWTLPNGDIITGPCTLTGIVPGSAMGDANTKSEFAGSIEFNGTPSVTFANKTDLPDSITATPVTVTVGETATASVTVVPVSASGKCVFSIEDSDVATVNSDGVVTGVTAGETKLTIKSAVKPSVNAQITVTVE